MRTLLLLPLLLVLLPQGQGGDGAPVAVVEFKWAKGRQTVVNADTASSTAPAAAMIPANKNFERNAREQAPAGVRDPNLDTIDGRSAAIEKSVQESRSPKTKTVDGYAYRVKMRNAGAKPVEVLFWEYQFVEAANPSNVTRRQFLCGVQMKPGKEKEVVAFSPSGPSGVVSAETLADKSRDSFSEKVVINRVEFSDGSIWQRKDWNFAEVKESVARATATPWGQEMCRGL